MKVLLSILVVCGLFLTSCSKQDHKIEVQNFFAALEKGDFETAKKLSTPETNKILVVVENEYAKNKDKIKDPKPIKVEVLEPKESDKKLEYQVKIDIGGTVKETTVVVSEVEKNWLIVIPADNLVILQFVVFHNQYNLIFVEERIKKTEVIHLKTSTVSNKKSKKSKKSGKKKSGKKHGK